MAGTRCLVRVRSQNTRRALPCGSRAAPLSRVHSNPPRLRPALEAKRSRGRVKGGYMPRKLERFPAAAASRYAWDELLDGDPWELVAGEDFTSKPTTLIANARMQAKRRGGVVRTRLLDNGDRPSVVIQFIGAS